jgi:O-antigen/teichoic acid export membrane protein
MIKFSAIKNNIKSLLGELWWYTLILFVAQRLGDVINAVIGIWLVPQYVRQDELGAVLPLSQVGNALAFPLAMFGYIFLKYINVFATRNEFGKLKALLRDTFIVMAILFVGIMLYARYFMPFVFERMRVADGMLGVLIVTSSLLSIASIFFSGALQALKKFRLASMLCLIAAPLRLITLLIFLPIRALSGYFVGQIVPTLYVIVASLFHLREILFNKGLKSTPYLRSDGPLMLRYAIPIMLSTTAGVVLALVDPFVIRHRLPDLESAAYDRIVHRFECGNDSFSPRVGTA